MTHSIIATGTSLWGCLFQLARYLAVPPGHCVGRTRMENTCPRTWKANLALGSPFLQSPLAHRASLVRWRSIIFSSSVCFLLFCWLDVLLAIQMYSQSWWVFPLGSRISQVGSYSILSIFFIRLSLCGMIAIRQNHPRSVSVNLVLLHILSLRFDIVG